MTTIDHLLVLAFVVLYPVYALLAYRKIKPDLVANKPGRRLSDYRETIAWLWLFGLWALVNWRYQDRSFSDLGLGFPSEWPAWTGLLVVALVSIFMALQLRKLRDDKEQRLALTGQLEQASASEFLPRTKQEFNWFIGLSITAGICEEILFRGFLIWYLIHFSMPVAIILSSIAFGLGHSYQGWQGVLRTSLIGLVLAVAYVLFGSLWPVIFFHIVGDIYSGALGRLAFGQDEAEPSGA